MSVLAAMHTGRMGGPAISAFTYAETPGAARSGSPSQLRIGRNISRKKLARNEWFA
jgi:hypothetical protein